MLDTFSIAEVAELAGVSKNTLIEWEKKGLILPDRDEKGWRVFSLDLAKYCMELAKSKQVR